MPSSAEMKNIMKFYKYLYIGDTVKEPLKVKWKLRSHVGQQIHVICLAKDSDQLEIYHCAYLKQKYYRYHPPVIVGIAADYEEAIGIIIKITEESLLTTGNCDLKEYLKYKVKSTGDKA